MTRKLDVLLSAYACEPGKGSEPEVGWRVCLEMARHCNVRVVTRANNRPAIETGLADATGPPPDFLYYDLPPLWLWLKKAALGTTGYYVLWQAAVRWKFRKLLKEVDLVHHVTFNGFQVPGFWFATDTPVVLGPLGGGMSCPRKLLKALDQGRTRERARSFLIHCMPMLPWWRASISNASLVIAANNETARSLRCHRGDEVPVMLETAFPESLVTTAPHPASGGPEFKVLWLGNLIPRKAPVLAVRALRRALELEPGIELIIAGSGPEEARLRREVCSLGVDSHVTMLGKIPKEEVETVMDKADAFLFTSVRDTSGNVVLEAMARGLPVIALWHQGMREICDPKCALVVPPDDLDGAIDGIAEAMVRLCQDRELARRIGRAGNRRIRERHTWKNFGERMLSLYTRAIE